MPPVTGMGILRMSSSRARLECILKIVKLDCHWKSETLGDDVTIEGCGIKRKTPTGAYRIDKDWVL